MSELREATWEQFDAVVGEDWELAVEVEGRGRLAVTFVLERAEVSGDLAPDAPRRPFSLVFRGPAEAVLPQGLYPLAHPAVGALEIFLVPFSRGSDGVRYEAVFA